jgi:1-acyl-sn-glycerol-3-phosphate acyltransferase
MTAARHDSWAQALFAAYVRRLLRRHFHALRLLGDPPAPPPGLPLLLVPNHSSWWDGLLLYELNRRVLGRRLHLMVLERHVAHFRFFRRVGAFTIRQGQRSEVSASLAYAASLLGDPANALGLFPQGAIRHASCRPLGFQRGVERILEAHGAPVGILPLAMRCEFYENQRPEALFLFDRCRVCGPGSYPGAGWLEERVAGLLDEAGRLAQENSAGRVLLEGWAQLGERWGAPRPGRDVCAARAAPRARPGRAGSRA